MESGFLNALFRDPVINRLAAKKTGKPGAAIPETVVAKVTTQKGDAAVLRWEGGTFSAILNAKAEPGEMLLLKYNGTRESRPHYKIMTRFPGRAEIPSTNARSEQTEPFLFAIMPGVLNKAGSAPALVRFLPRGQKEPAHKTASEPLLEIFIDTDNFGLMVVRFYFYPGSEKLECQFVVESKAAGEALQREAERLVNEAGGEQKQGRALQWSVGNLHRMATEALQDGGINLNKKA